MEFLARLFDPTGFPARWQCGDGWTTTPWLGWLHILSDLGVWSGFPQLVASWRLLASLAAPLGAPAPREAAAPSLLERRARLLAELPALAKSAGRVAA